MTTFNFGDVWQLVMTNGELGAEVQIIAETKQDLVAKVFFYKPRCNRVDSLATKLFLEDYRPSKGYGKESK
jgi:hypothetical protein